jgi:hypothetical protein
MSKAFYLLAQTVFSCLSAGEAAKPKVEKIPITIEARFSYFWPESQTFRNIYHNGGIDYQLTGTVPVYQGDLFSLRGLNFWWAADYFQREGESIGLGTKTTIQMEPLTAGLKWIYPKTSIRPYFGAGFKYYFVQLRNSSSYVTNQAYFGAGFVAETGLQMFLAKYFMMDVFLAYSFKQFGSRIVSKTNVTSTWFDVGGLNVGGGMGVKF